jgi:hypothetical protein
MCETRGSNPAIAGSFIGGFQTPTNPPRATIGVRRHLKPFTLAVIGQQECPVGHQMRRGRRNN